MVSGQKGLCLQRRCPKPMCSYYLETQGAQQNSTKLPTCSYYLETQNTYKRDFVSKDAVQNQRAHTTQKLNVLNETQQNYQCAHTTQKLKIHIFSMYFGVRQIFSHFFPISSSTLRHDYEGEMRKWMMRFKQYLTPASFHKLGDIGEYVWVCAWIREEPLSVSL